MHHCTIKSCWTQEAQHRHSLNPSSLHHGEHLAMHYQEKHSEESVFTRMPRPTTNLPTQWGFRHRQVRHSRGYTFFIAHSLVSSNRITLSFYYWQTEVLPHQADCNLGFWSKDIRCMGQCLLILESLSISLLRILSTNKLSFQAQSIYAYFLHPTSSHFRTTGTI